MATMKTNLIAGLVAVVVMIIAVVALSGGPDDANDLASGGKDPTATTTATPEATTATPEATTTTIVDDVVVRFSDLETIGRDELTAEALSTLTLIDQGGPYPYSQDDGTFQNREGILPDRDREHYREYTVDTPGSSDRGARRIVAGADGERYYTGDHYDSFREIVE